MFTEAIKDFTNSMVLNHDVYVPNLCLLKFVFIPQIPYNIYIDMNIIEKSPEILQSQLGQVNLYREVKERKGSFGPDFTEWIASFRGLRRFQYRERKYFQEIVEARKNDPETAFKGASFLEKLARPEVNLLLTPEDQRDLANRFIENNRLILLTPKSAELLIVNGVLDKESVTRIVFQDIEGINYAAMTDELLPLVPDITSQQLHDSFIEAFAGATDPSQISNIAVAKNYLSEEELLTIAKRFLQMSPDLYEIGDEGINHIFSGDSQFGIARIIVEHPNLRLFDETRGTILKFQKMTPEQRRYLYDLLFDRWEAVMEERKRLSAQFSDGEDVPEDVKIQDMFIKWGSLDSTIRDYPIEGRATFALRVLKNVSSRLFEDYFGKVLDDLDGSGIVELVNDAYKTQDETRLYIFLMYLGGCADKTSQEQFLDICRKLSGILPEYFQEDDTN